MALKQVNILNKGMSQDYSISKDSQEYAFKNKNIRIQSLDDNTLLSVTNVKGPKKISTDVTIEGTVVGKCFTGDYLVLFTCGDKDRIYRVDIRRISNIKVFLLYEGNLGFSLSKTYDTTFYYENSIIQKVYWVESWQTKENEEDSTNPYYTSTSDKEICNFPRVINIITEGERLGKAPTQYTENIFDFYPEIETAPTFKIKKDYNIPSEHPSGLIQYFISYYFDNGAETLIASNSSTFVVGHYNKGAKADETGACGFRLTIKNIDTKFDYFRVYSAIRTSKDGPLLVKIVNDVKINKTNKNASYVLTDTGINQETLEASHLYFIGGTPFYASTLEQKNDTLFLGNIKTIDTEIPLELQEALNNRKIYYYKIKTPNGKKLTVPFKFCESTGLYCTTLNCYKQIYDSIPEELTVEELENKYDFYEACVINPSDFNIVIGNSDNLYRVDGSDITFTNSQTELSKVLPANITKDNYNKYLKSITLFPNTFSKYYNYRLLTENSSMDYKTFKGGEMYRFGIQFLNKQGLWTNVAWIGDKECETYPIIDNENHHISLNNAVYVIPDSVKKICRKLGFKNYRIVLANPETQNGRRVQALGVLCPTLFSPGQRALGTHSISSWIMRPKGMACSHHHFEPITSAFAAKGGEIFGIDVGRCEEFDGVEVPDNYPGLDKNEKQLSTYGSKWYNDPYYRSDYETTDIPRYLIIQMSIHSGHKCALKATEIASNYADTLFWNEERGEYDYLIIGKTEKSEGNVINYCKDYGSGGWGKVREDLVLNFLTFNWDARDILTIDTFKKIASKLFWGEFLTIWTLVTTVIAIIGMGLAGAASMVVACVGQLLLMMSLPEVAVGTFFLGKHLDTMAENGIVGKGKKEWQKELLRKGYVLIDTNAFNKLDTGKEIFGEVNGVHLLPSAFASKGLNVGQEGYSWGAGNNGLNAVHFIKIVPLSGRKYLAEEIEKEFNRFYVDESIVTFHSPDVENCRDKHLQLRVVGTAPINSIYSDVQIQTSTIPYIENGGLDYSKLIDYRKVETLDTQIDSILSSDYLYWDGLIEITDTGKSPKEENKLKWDKYFFTSNAALYKMFLWDKSGSITGGTKEMTDVDGKQVGVELPSIVKNKTILNQLNSFGTNYFNNYNANVVYPNLSKIEIFNGEKDTSVFNSGNTTILYKGNYDHLISYKHATNPHIEYDENNNLPELVCGPETPNNVRIRYNSSQHAIFDLYALANNRKYLLPYVEGEVPYKQGNVNYKASCEDEKDAVQNHLWQEGDDSRIKAVDTCWTDNSNWFYDDVYFKAIPLINPENIDNIESILNTKLNLFDLCNIKACLKNSKHAHIGIVTFTTGNAVNANIKEYLERQLKKEVLTGAVPKGNYSLKRNDKTYSGKITYYKYVITDIVIDDLGYITKMKGYYTSSKYNEYVYVDSFDISKGRFLWKINNDSSDKCYPYIDFPIKYEQPKINSSFVPNNKYLFVGELFYDLKPYELYNGFNNIDNLLWYPISRTTSIENNINRTEGDTYYQRWDCLKTYPSTIEDETNKVVDIASFMVETHRNLDTRTDSNRDFYNIMSRPENFNLFNPVYDSTNNLFLYTTTKESFTKEFKNLVTWSLKKNFDAKVDSWTSISLSSLSSTRNAITKLVNFNNSLLALTSNSIDKINYDGKNFVATDSEFIELANSTKVNGIVNLYNTYGTTNQSVLITERGLYFIDDNENSIIRISLDGSINKIAASKMDSWFKNNIVKGSFTYNTFSPFHLEYDSKHKDIYIINKDYCLIYNENLEAFTSFMDYLKCYTLINIGGSVLAVTEDSLLYNMFEGDYNTTFDGTPIDYSVLYRINPDPYTDKVFTNVEFIADCINENGLANNAITPFDSIHVWNEYQDTENSALIFNRHNSSSLKQKFRIWRADIPRDAMSKYKRDRIRNPWINMTLSKKTNGDNFKMELHSMNVHYMG